MYRYRMQSDRIDRFQSGELFIEQLADSLRAESTVVERPRAEKEPEPSANKEAEKRQATNTADDNGGDSDEIHIEL